MGFKKSILACAALSVCLAMVAAGDDWANFGRYEAQNAEVLQLPAKERNVVFLGNSITENWARIHPEFFKKHGFVPRGISGQTSYQFLLRFVRRLLSSMPVRMMLPRITMPTMKTARLAT